MTARRALPAGVCAVLLATVAVAASGCAAQRGGSGHMGVRADVLEAASSVPTAEGVLAVYELQIRNEGDAPARVERIVRRRTDRPGEETLAGPGLERRVVTKRRVAETSQRLDVPAGGRAVVLLDAARDATAAAPSFEHDVVLSGVGETGRTFEETITATERAPSADPPVVLAAPLAGTGWVCENGPATLSGHRRAVVWLRGAPRAAQRFAVDFFRADGSGRTESGDPRRNESHFAFGAEVLAVADASVADASDGIPDNVPDPSERAVEMSNETVAGNHVVLDLGSGRFAMYAHLRQGTVAVRKGDRVRRGQVLAHVGNSGNSTEPHLHFHVADGPSPVDASGLPFVFEGFSCRGAQFAGVLPAEGSTVDF